MTLIRVFLLDDDSTFFDAAEQFVGTLPDVKLLGRGRTTAETLSRVTQLRPDLVIATLQMHDRKGIVAVHQVKAMENCPRVFLVSRHGEQPYRDVAVALRSDAFVLEEDFAAAIPGLIAGLAGREPDEPVAVIEPRLASAGAQPYGDLTELNTERLILDSIGQEVLADIVGDYLGLLETSAAIYEINGDYAKGIFTSGWCRKLDETSRKLCGTDDNREALRCGKWSCHESCWDTSRAAIETGRPADLPCLGGIRIHAVPIHAGGRIVGAINFGYGAPPRDRQKLEELADRYGLDVSELTDLATTYKDRAPWIIDVAKHKLAAAARIIGAMIEQRQTEKALRRATTELERSNADLQQFAYVASHDLQEPLRAVSGCVQLLQKKYGDHLDPGADELIAHTVEGVLRMQGLIADLLAYARVGSRGQEFAPVDLGLVLDQALANLAVALTGTGGHVTRGPLPVVSGDAGQLAQLLQNLIGNSLKFRGPGPPEIHVSASREESHWHIQVADNGIGIDRRYFDRIFTMFQRLHTRTEYPGSGIGLAIARKIVERHDGKIWPESEPGKGTTIHFTLRSERGVS